MERSDVFVGMSKNVPGLFFLGEVVSFGEKPGEVVMKNVVRSFEMQDERMPGKVMNIMQPDPYFTCDKASTFFLCEFMGYRVEADPESQITMKYQKFMTTMRAQRSGLMMASGNQEAAAKKILTEMR
jgi:hypothetical protein